MFAWMNAVAAVDARVAEVVFAAKRLNEGEAVKARHPQIGQDQVRRVERCLLEAPPAVCGLCDLKARRAHVERADQPDGWVVVHHGAFWGGVIPITGRRQDILSTLFQNSIGVYSSHLPLDCHPTIGNNVLLAREFGLQPASAFGKFSGVSIGVAGDSSDSLSELVESVGAFARMHGGSVRSTPFEKGRAIGQWAICSGSGADSETLAEASARGIQTLIVGEGPHWTAVYAEENEIALIYAGHYASETLGVQALAAAISTEFGIAWEFLPSPTGT